MNNITNTVEPGEWIIKAEANLPSKFWEVLERLNEKDPQK